MSDKEGLYELFERKPGWRFTARCHSQTCPRVTAIFYDIDLFEHVFRYQLENVLEKCHSQNELWLSVLIFTEYEHEKSMKKLGSIWLQIFGRGSFFMIFLKFCYVNRKNLKNMFFFKVNVKFEKRIRRNWKKMTCSTSHPGGNPGWRFTAGFNICLLV